MEEELREERENAPFNAGNTRQRANNSFIGKETAAIGSAALK